MVRIFIQARMSSTRFPGKVLAPLQGRPLIAHLISAASQVVPPSRVAVLTSTENSDDPLACYANEIGVCVFRGALDDVLSRYQSCLRKYPCEWFFRVCADSPWIDPALLEIMLGHRDEAIDLITNVFPRTFPKGQSAELLKATTFAALEPNTLTREEKEHVTLPYYRRSNRFRIVNIRSSDARLAAQSFVVDTLDDLRQLEGMSRSDRFSARRSLEDFQWPS
jgi:spore coat polysaccharide biosynthesis protein SpsF